MCDFVCLARRGVGRKGGGFSYDQANEQTGGRGICLPRQPAVLGMKSHLLGSLQPANENEITITDNGVDGIGLGA